jgi:hypothetical protein
LNFCDWFLFPILICLFYYLLNGFQWKLKWMPEQISMHLQLHDYAIKPFSLWFQACQKTYVFPA